VIRRLPPLLAAGIAVGVALVVAGVWCGRAQTPAVETAEQGTVAVRISRHDALGMSPPPIGVRDPARVRALVRALGIDAQPETKCPPDYASAELGLLLTGRDVYARRNVYVWGVLSDAGAPIVLIVSSSGCRGGPPADAVALRQELVAADAGGP
jgi:hypothetical protein